jgi:cation transport protein ChaC
MLWRGRYWRVRLIFSLRLLEGISHADVITGNGPSGENKEYLYNLGTALLGLSHNSGDAHVGDLVQRCKRLEQEAGVGRDEGDSSTQGLYRVGSTEEQEEVEK